MLTDGVYNYKDGRQVAMGTDIYYPVKNEVIRFGGIGSDGTAYPITANTTGIYTAGVWFQSRLILNESKQILIKGLACFCYICFY